MSAELHCRVCGLAQLDPPWGADGRSPLFEFCDCCGVEFGYGDATPAAVVSTRAKWLAGGAVWSEPAARPSNWNLDAQLAKAPE